ncbi:MAG: glycosyl hydrolase, partial [Ktedonobacteraceae bacterium]
MTYQQDQSSPTTLSDPNMLKGLEWRSLGPYRGGRVVAVAGDPFDKQRFYFGSTGGGVWQTTDGGLIWENISDGYFKRASVGAIAVAQADPNVIYVGMGETTIRGNVSHGDGMYKSTDRGQTWTHLGLEATRQIAKVRIHPHNPDLAYVAALGHAHGPNPERGIYRTRDGGKTWENILYRSEKAGAIDLVMDPHNPRILYATFWEAVRLPHTLISGGEDSGIFKSTDGGDTWNEISRKPGLPQGLLGKIGLAASPAQAGRIWAIVEAEDGAVFRSDDGGEHWQRLCDEHGLFARAWYYQHIFADPQDAETLWVLNTQAWKSIDGGKTFFDVSTPHADNHDLWIDPENPQRVIESNDGGACISFNGGESWSTQANQPTIEFYHVTTDNQVPYRIYGAQQDNTTISLPTRSALAGITQLDWYDVGGGESGYIAVRPDDSNIVYAGNYQGAITRYDHRTRQARNIAVWPELASGWGADAQRYRFQWTAPIMLSPHDPNILYITGNYVFRSTNEGQSWQTISPDLTRNDSSRLGSSGGPITKDNTGAEYYGTIFAFAESPCARGLFWAGSDDGLIHLSRDDGKTWQQVTPANLPEWALISIIEPSPYDPAVAYVAATSYKSDDFTPYLYRTSDYGTTWDAITTGIPDHDFTRVIRVDPVRRGLLYAGTETGVYVSLNDGEQWQPLQLNLPVVPIHDLVVKDSDLIAATHGRSFWVLDDITPLRQVSEQIEQSAAHLFTPRPTIRFMTVGGFSQVPVNGKYSRKTGVTTINARREEKPTGEKIDRNLDAGQNPPNGVIVTYYLKEQPVGEVKLIFLDTNGQEIKRFSSEEAPADPQKAGSSKKNGNGKPNGNKDPRVPKEAGTNRFAWNMRYPDPSKVSEGFMGADNGLVGPVVSPGTYQVRLIVGEQSLSVSFEIQKDPRVAASQRDLDDQCALLLSIRDRLSETHEAITLLRDTRQQVEQWEQRTTGRDEHEAIAEAAKVVQEKLTAIEEEL